MSANYRLKINDSDNNEKIERAFRHTCLGLGRKFTEVITKPRSWEGRGKIEDIVDMGMLRSSQLLVFNGRFSAVFAWTMEYAPYVHQGYTSLSGEEIVGRPWTKIAIREFDPQRKFIELLNNPNV